MSKILSYNKMPKKQNLGHSVYGSSEGGRHRSSGSNVTEHMPNQPKRCKGLKCDKPYRVPDDPNGPVRYSLERCKRACAEGSNLCGLCTKQYGVPGKWHAKIGDRTLHPTSHARDPRFPMSNWNRGHVAKAASRSRKKPVKSPRHASGSPRSNTRRRANRGASPSPSKQEIKNEALAAYLKGQSK